MSRTIENWRVFACPPDDYSEWAQATGSLLAMPIWSEALIAVGAEPLFAWNPVRGIGALIASFRRCGFRIGVLGFPVVGERWGQMASTELARCVACIGELAGLDLLRMNFSMASRFDRDAIAARPEAWIDDLRRWQPVSRRLQKDLAFARRANPALEIVHRCVDPNACFRMYSAIVGARGGRLRYTSNYFVSLASIAERTDHLRMFTALDVDQCVRGFAVLALHGGTDAQVLVRPHRRDHAGAHKG